MSIYFFHVIQAYFGITIWLALLGKKLQVKEFLLSFLIGLSSAFAFFKISSDYLWIDQLKIFSDIFAITLLLLFWFVYFLRSSLLKIAITSFLIFSFSIYYRVFSHNFPLFSGELLDTMSIVSFGLTILGFCSIILLYIFLRYLALSLNIVAILFSSIILTLSLALKTFGDVSLELMRMSVLPTYSWLLSITAKLIHYGLLLPYLFSFIVLVLIIVYLRSMPKIGDKKIIGSIEFRKIKAKRDKIFNISKCLIAILIASNAFLLYYDLIASRPPTISAALVLEPVDGEFRIPIEDLRDNDLHRYAYITDAGNKIRFFVLNRFPDRDSPSAVFDSCMICGDIGYIKQDGELICVACNVRIFLPSVGKEGGCNPTPFPFEFDGKEVIIKLEEIEKGANYFSEVVEKTVIDPVTGEEVINLRAPYNYTFGRKTYFFKSKESYDLFRNDPNKYVGAAKESYWRAKGYQALGSKQ